MNTAPEKIDLTGIVRGILRACRHLLLWGIILCLVLGAALGFYSYRSYTPLYTASVSFTVQTTNPLYSSQQYYNASTAEQLAKTFPYILTSGVLLQQVQQELQISSMPSLSASVLGSTNIFTLSSTSTDPQLAYDVLKCVVEIYPSVAEFVVGPTSMTLIDDSGVPAYPANTLDLRRSVVLGVAAGIALWLLICFLYWLTHRTVNTEQELQKLVNLPYLGNIPRLPGFGGAKNKGKCPVLSSRSDKFGFSESIRLLRIRVERAMEKENAKTLLVTSTIANEGKTTLAINLATALAQKGKRVLLIDCDLRNPSIAATYGQEKMPGFSEYLQDKCSLEDTLYHTKNPNLYVIFAGRPVAHPEKLLRKESARELLVSAEGTFDYILLDTPPCALLSDAADICSLADCAVLSVRQDFSCHSQVLEAIQILGDCGRPILGTVLSMTAPHSKISSYFRYGSSYYGYGGYGGYGYERKDAQPEIPTED